MTDRQGLPRQKSEGYSIVITEDEEASALGLGGA